jgi:hypothetical protein
VSEYSFGFSAAVSKTACSTSNNVNSAPDSLSQELGRLDDEGNSLLESVKNIPNIDWKKHPDVEEIWNSIGAGVADRVQQLLNRVSTFGTRLLRLAEASPLITPYDREMLVSCARKMLASLNIAYYWEHESRVVESPTNPQRARQQWLDAVQEIRERLPLFASAPETSEDRATRTSSRLRSYRPNTAFIMMWISDDQPELEDIKNTIKFAFDEFGIQAIRSDEIEHEGTITQRILDEIATSEFLIADLTGERPSVYYEIGYAHALDKRVILYRRKGTRLHFDLSVHNVPEYDNLTDLRNKLMSRLAAVTGREPRSKTALGH